MPSKYLPASVVAVSRDSEHRFSKRVVDAIVRVTGLRNPCQQINGFEPGLLREVLGRTNGGAVERKGGVMAVVIAGGTVRAGDEIRADLPEGIAIPLAPVEERS